MVESVARPALTQPQQAVQRTTCDVQQTTCGSSFGTLVHCISGGVQGVLRHARCGLHLVHADGRGGEPAGLRRALRREADVHAALALHQHLPVSAIVRSVRNGAQRQLAPHRTAPRTCAQCGWFDIKCVAFSLRCSLAWTCGRTRDFRMRIAHFAAAKPSAP